MTSSPELFWSKGLERGTMVSPGISDTQALRNSENSMLLKPGLHACDSPAGQSTSYYSVAMVCLEPAVEGFWHGSNQAKSSKSMSYFESSSVRSTVLFRLFPVWW